MQSYYDVIHTLLVQLCLLLVGRILLPIQCNKLLGLSHHLNHVHSGRTGRTVFSQLTDGVMRHKAKDGVVYAIRSWFKYDTAPSAVV